MSISGGSPNDLLRPLRHDGNATEEARGCHMGPAQALNVYKARDGFMYYWVRHPRVDRGTQLQRFVNEGWEIVPPEAAEHKGRETSLNYSQFGLDNIQVHGDVLMLRIPEDKYRTMSEYRVQLAKVAREGPTAEYERKAESLPEHYRSRADGPIYYRGAGHGYQEY
jgi:hypothetical protein